MAAPRQMTSETLNALKGWGTNMYAVDFSAKLDAGALATAGLTRLPAGSVVVLSPTLTYTIGVGTARKMPMFTFNASDDPDVANDGGDPATVKGAYIGVTPSGNMMALVAVGALELVTTSYDAANAITYAPNDFLTSLTAAAGGIIAGLLTKATWSNGTGPTKTVVGVVSRGVVDNGYGSNALAFWPWYFPVI